MKTLIIVIIVLLSVLTTPLSIKKVLDRNKGDASALIGKIDLSKMKDLDEDDPEEDPAVTAKREAERKHAEEVRKATEQDTATYQKNLSLEKEAAVICQEKIRKHNLDMKLIDAEYTFDNSKILFYFTADGRVDFRELVRDLASVFRTRIELRQIGVRDETKIIGGYGICGRKLCCQAYLSDFVPVSIKMAKEQNLSLNPTKISGACGRLMCCLKYEEETYEELNKNLPRQGDEVRGSDGLVGEVESVNVLRQTVRILVEVDNEKEYHEYGVDDITIVRRRRRGQARQARKEKKENSSREMKELQKLEHEDKKSGKSRLRE